MQRLHGEGAPRVKGFHMREWLLSLLLGGIFLIGWVAGHETRCGVCAETVFPECRP